MMSRPYRHPLSVASPPLNTPPQALSNRQTPNSDRQPRWFPTEPQLPKGQRQGDPGTASNAAGAAQAATAHLSLLHATCANCAAFFFQAGECASPLSAAVQAPAKRSRAPSGAGLFRPTPPTSAPAAGGIYRPGSRKPTGLPCSSGPGTKPSPAQRLT